MSRVIKWTLVGLCTLALAAATVIILDLSGVWSASRFMGENLAKLPVLGGMIRTYNLGVKQSRLLTEEKARIEDEMQRLEITRGEIKRQVEELRKAQEELQFRQSELDRQANELLKRNAQATGWDKMARLCSGMQPADAARILSSMPDSDVVGIIGRIQEKHAASILVAMDPQRAAKVLVLIGRP